MKQFGANSRQLFGDSDPNAVGPNPPTKNSTGQPSTTGAKPGDTLSLGDMAIQSYFNKQPGQSWTRSMGMSYLAQKLAGGAAEAVGKKSLQAKQGELGPDTPADGSKFDIAFAAGKPHVGKTWYSWGGGTPKGPGRGFAQGAPYVGFDCSSLVQFMAAKAGVKLPRTTTDQVKSGTAVNAGNRASWQPGDLIFPHSGHVQMYLGNGKIIEAPSTGKKIQITNVRSGTPYAVRRIF
jgi:cell wall-associated NlpC family hydrolase